MILGRVINVFVAGCLAGLLAFTPGLCGAAEGPLSPVSLAASPNGDAVYVAEATANQIAVVDPASGQVVKTIALADPPLGMALSPDGTRLYVTGAAVSGKVYIVALPEGTVAGSIAAGHTPTALAVSPDGKTLYVCNRFDNAIGVIDTAAGQQVASISVLREPVAAALTPDGINLVVANHLPAGAADGDYTSAVVSIIDTASRAVTSEIALPNGSTGLRGVCVSPDGAFAYVTHLLGRYHLPTTQLERGWMNTNAISVIDAAKGALVNTVLLDSVDLGAANPWGVACSADGAVLCVTHAGSHELSVIDRAALQDRLAKVAAGEAVTEVSKTAAEVPNDLAFLVDIQRRIRLTGNGPRGLALLGTKAFAAEYFSDSLAMVDLAAAAPKAQSIALGDGGEKSQERIGEMYFNDASLCFQHWQSCASCHPDGRADSLNWDLLNDGIGNPKNTKSMLLSHQTPPVMSLGVRETAEKAVRSGIRFIQFAERPEEDAAAIDAYLKTLKPVAGPESAAGRSAAAERGAAVFEQAGCLSCHMPPLYTDLKQYDVGTGKDREAGQSFDTPTLIEVWRTGPYLHDGRSKTMEEVLTSNNAEDKHGSTSKLTPEQIADLAAFVNSL